MNSFFKQYFSIINYAIIGIVFGYASFYLFLNLYHYQDIRRTYDVNGTVADEVLVKNVDLRLKNIEENINLFDVNKYRGTLDASKLNLVSANLKVCLNYYNNDVYKELKKKSSINIIDVYKLREAYENEVLNGCIVKNLYWVSDIEKTDFEGLKQNSFLLKMYFKDILSTTSYLKKDLLNNTAYSFSTEIFSKEIKNISKDGFYDVMNSYNSSLNIVEYISNWLKQEAEAGV